MRPKGFEVGYKRLLTLFLFLMIASSVGQELSMEQNCLLGGPLSNGLEVCFVKEGELI